MAVAESLELPLIFCLTVGACQDTAAVQAEVCQLWLQMHVKEEHQGADVDVVVGGVADAAERLPADCHACVMPAVLTDDAQIGELVGYPAVLSSCGLRCAGKLLPESG